MTPDYIAKVLGTPFAQVRVDIAQHRAKQEIARREYVRQSLPQFFLDREPTHILGAWLDELFVHLEWARQTPDARLMIFAPPRAGKSQAVSRILPPFILGHSPHHEVMAVSASQDLADGFGLYVRNTLNDPRYQDLFPKAAIDQSSNSVSRITLQAKGGYRGVGVGGQIVGLGADWLIIDDPYKNRDEAKKQSVRDAVFDWYTTSARNRLAPGGRIVLMHQRFTTDDLADRLLAIAKTDPDADQWRVVSFPAIHEEGAPPDILGREVGEALFPERWTVKALKAIRATMTDADWLAMYQQRPTAIQGAYFTRDSIQFYAPQARPKNLRWYMGVDLAVSVNTHADCSAIVAIGLDEESNIYLAPDYIYGKLPPDQTIEKMLDMAARYKPMYIAGEKGPIDSAIRPFLTVRMRERKQFISLRTITRSAAKHIMATPLQARMEHRKVFFPDDRRTREVLIPQFLNFMPDIDNKEDDLVDALTNVIHTLGSMVAPSVPVAPKVDDDADDKAMWAKIMASGNPAPASPILSLNGNPYKRKTG